MHLAASQIVLQRGLLVIAAITGGDLRKIVPMFYEEELTADDMIAGGRRQLAAVNTKFSFEFFLHNAFNCIRRAFTLLTETYRRSRVKSDI